MSMRSGGVSAKRQSYFGENNKLDLALKTKEFSFAYRKPISAPYRCRRITRDNKVRKY
jgi:hypothetical protein